MDKDLSTTLHIYGIGRVVADKANESDVVVVSMTELLPSLNGTLSANENTKTINAVSPRGGRRTGKVNVGSGIPCKWWDFGSNRLSAPDVVKDERVIVWRKGDSSSEYFWTPTRLDENKRQTEHVVTAYSNTKKGNRKPKRLSKENSYTQTFSTKEKYIEILTAKSDGEKFRYQLKIDTKNNYFVLKDDDGNRILLNSAERLIDFTNKDKTHIRLSKKDIDVYTPGHFTQKTDGNYTLRVGGNVIVEVGGSYNYTVAGAFIGNTGAWAWTAPSMTATVNTVLFNCPSTTFTGNVTALSLSIGGGGGAAAKSSGPSATVQGGMSVVGGLAVDSLNADSIDADSIKVGGGGINSTGAINGPNGSI